MILAFTRNPHNERPSMHPNNQAATDMHHEVTALRADARALHNDVQNAHDDASDLAADLRDLRDAFAASDPDHDVIVSLNASLVACRNALATLAHVVDRDPGDEPADIAADVLSALRSRADEVAFTEVERDQWRNELCALAGENPNALAEHETPGVIGKRVADEHADALAFERKGLDDSDEPAVDAGKRLGRTAGLREAATLVRSLAAFDQDDPMWTIADRLDAWASTVEDNDTTRSDRRF